MNYGHVMSLLVTALLIPLSWAVDCQNAGILVDIHSRQVNGRADIFRYGLSIGLGTPSQNNSLWPAITNNETAFSAPDYCGADDPRLCLDGTRGFFSTENSSSWRNTPSYRTLDDTSGHGDATRVNGEDTLDIWQTQTYGGPQTLMQLDHFPVAVLSNYTSLFDLTTFYGPGGILGLGSASTVLTKLVEQGMIAARSFGLYLGPGFDRLGDERSGSLTLGGYDAGKFNGSVAMYDLVPALPENMLSPFKITVDDVSLVTSGGETVIKLADDSFDAYLTTDRRPIRFPAAVTTKLTRALNATPADNDDATLKLSSTFEGNLTMTLSNNLTLVFDAAWMMDSWLVTPISAGPEANSSFASFTTRDVDPVIFGAAFLARAYMFVNYDANPPNFGLAQALPDVTEIQRRPYCAHDIPFAATSVQDHSRASFRKALIGGLCGGLLGGILALTLIWYFFGSRIRKHLRRNDPRLRTDKDSYFDRPSIKQTFHYWKSKNWKTIISGDVQRNANYFYNDAESGQTNQMHVSALMSSSYDSEKGDPLHSLPKPSYNFRGAESPSSPSREIQQDDEKNLMSASYVRKPVSSPKRKPLNSPYNSASMFFSTASKSIVNGMSATRLVSAFNTRGQPQSGYSKSTSQIATKYSPMDELVTASTKIPVIDVTAIPEPERQAYDKSLPATPAPSTPRSLLSRLSQATFPQSESDAASSAKTPRIPSFAFTPTNITFIPPKGSVPPIPAIPSGYASNAAKVEGSSIALQQEDQTNTDSLEHNPISASSVYSFWRTKRSRSLATSRSSSLHNRHPETTTFDTQQQERLTRSATSSTRSRSQSRSRMALAARISRFKDRQQTGVREIVIHKRSRSRSKSRSLPIVDLSAFSNAPDEPIKSHTPTFDLQPAANVYGGSVGRFLIKRKAVNTAPAPTRQVSGVSPYVSGTADDLLVTLGDRAISPVSSMGRGRDFDLDDIDEVAPPPLPPFPAGLYTDR